MIKAEACNIINLRRPKIEKFERIGKKILPAYLCIFSPETLNLAVHAYSLYNNRSKNLAEQLFLSDPAKSTCQN